jgi:hypothetical protein
MCHELGRHASPRFLQRLILLGQSPRPFINMIMCAKKIWHNLRMMSPKVLCLYSVAQEPSAAPSASNLVEANTALKVQCVGVYKQCCQLVVNVCKCL